MAGTDQAYSETLALQPFLEALGDLPDGYITGHYHGHLYGVTIRRAAGGRNIKLYGEALGERDRISFNLYQPGSGKVLLKPCEMPAEKVIAFVLGFQPGL